MYFSLYTPLVLSEVTLDGRPAQMEGAIELGSNVYSRFVSVPPQTSVELKFELTGTVASGRYRLVGGVDDFETEQLDRDLRFASVPNPR
jgi:hypothetical protein